MRMSRESTLTARDILRTAGLDELAQIFRVYGEEKARARLPVELLPNAITPPWKPPRNSPD